MRSGGGAGGRAYGTSTVPSEAIVATHVEPRGKFPGRHLHDHVQEITARAGGARCIAVDEAESLVRGGARPARAHAGERCGARRSRRKMRRSAPPSVTLARRRASTSSYFAPGRCGYRRSGFGTESFWRPKASPIDVVVVVVGLVVDRGSGSLPSRPGATIKTAKTATAVATARRATPPSLGASWPVRHAANACSPPLPGFDPLLSHHSQQEFT